MILNRFKTLFRLLSRRDKPLFMSAYPQYAFTVKCRHLIDSKHIPGRPDQPIYDEWKMLLDGGHNLLTNAGKDLYHTLNFTSATTGANWIALTESTITPGVTDTTLTGEIATNGLERAQATTRTHSAAANTSTLSKTFTASGSFTSVLAVALFDAAVSGNMAHEANFSTGSGTLVSGDQLAVTGTMTLS